MLRKCCLTALCLLLFLCAFAPAMAEDGPLRGYQTGQGFQYIYIGNFPQGAEGQEAPLLWRILQVADGRAYLLSENVLEARQVHHAWETYDDWLESDLYGYLNGDFLHRAFSEAEQQLLVRSVSPGTVFLPTYEEYQNLELGIGKNADRESKGTEYAINNGLFTYRGGTYAPFWTRTVDPNHAGSTRRILSGGSLGYIRAIVSDLGSRPAIYLDVEKILPLLEGTGTIEAPFTLRLDAPATEAPAEGQAAVIPHESILLAEGQAVQEGWAGTAVTASPPQIITVPTPPRTGAVLLSPAPQTPSASATPQHTPPATPAATPAATPEPTRTPKPTPTPRPTAAPRPTPTPTRTPKPTATPKPTPTPKPSKEKVGELTFSAEVLVTANRNQNHVERILDRDMLTYWGGDKNSSLEFVSQQPVRGFYILWAEPQVPWQVQVPEGEGWRTVYTNTDVPYLHEYTPLDGLTHFRVTTLDGTGRMEIAEVYLLADENPPDWVQQWQPTVEKADIMVFAAHPDDELLYMGGTIPTYAGEMGLDVLMVTMTASSRTRRTELLNAVWAAGLRNYPVWGNFEDKNYSSMQAVYNAWGYRQTRDFLTEIYRKYRPEVVITHDPEGEYGHAIHLLCANLALYCMDAAANPAESPESAARYGTWQVKKLYQHLYPENGIVMNWRVPLEHYGGKTALEVAQEAFQEHQTQVRNSPHFKVQDSGKYNNTVFGLVYSTVGRDRARNDFLENIELPDGKTRPPVPTLPEADTLFPPLNEQGFLDEGEFIYQDVDRGLWLYASPTLRVMLQRKSDATQPLLWYDAEIWAAEGEIFSVEQIDIERNGKRYTMPHLIARQNQSVFALTADYYNYRVNRRIHPGIILRGGEIISDKTFKRTVNRFPNLDTMAILPDGSLSVFHNDEHTAEEYLAMGAKDVLAFGPYLIRDGEVNPFVYERPGSLNPRIAMGMIEPGHYVCILVEGRFQDESQGTDLIQLSEMMEERGCVEVLNLDGGQTAVMIFMGEQVSRIASYNGGNTSPRDAYEVLTIGFSPRTPTDLEE